jgi:hypothetical protein
MAEFKVVRCILPSRDINEIAVFVVDYYANVWKIKKSNLELMVMSQMNEIPETVIEQFEKRTGEFYFLANAKTLTLKIRYYFNIDLKA